MLARVALLVFLSVQQCDHVTASSNSTLVSGWVDDPDGRGTFSIISSCLLTLSLCVYTSIHLNIRPREKNELQSWVETSKWVGFGVLAPELLVFIAWRQYASAMNLDRSMRKLKEDVSNSTELECQNLSDHEQKSDAKRHGEFGLHNPWTSTHSFYANMGGFVFDIDDDDVPERDRFTMKHTRLTLTPRGFLLLAKCGFLPYISERDILDKSKADNVSKLLSLLQALWMLFQILGRLIARLPVTLLEVNTLAHIICAIIIYLLWWNKPKLITEPTKLKGEWVAPIFAYMYMSSHISGWRRARPGILKKYWKDPELSILAFNPPNLTCSTSPPSTSVPEVLINSNDAMGSPIIPSLQSNPSSGTLSLRPISALTNTDSTIDPAAILQDIESRLQSSQDLQAQRWSLAAKAMTLYPAIASRVTRRETRENIPSPGRLSMPSGSKKPTSSCSPTHTVTTYLEPMTEELIDTSIGNWARENLLRNMSGFVMGMIVWSASVLYGGMHLAAWNSFFPTPVERLLWRLSALCIASSGILWIFINLSAQSSPAIKAYWKRVESLRADIYSLVGLGSLATLCGLAYVFARLFLAVESLISLRLLPQGAFDTMQWSQVVPHL